MVKTESSLAIPPGALAQVVESVFENMLSLEVAECGTPWFPGSDRLTSAVYLTGAWNAALLLECDRIQACTFAGRFLCVDTPKVVDDVVRDVLGELANMIGGNLKCVMTPGIQLSMPTVVDGSQYSLRICRTEVRDQLTFRFAEDFFWVTVLATSLRDALFGG
jgi:chemotaxis protein CheX